MAIAASPPVRTPRKLWPVLFVLIGSAGLAADPVRKAGEAPPALPGKEALPPNGEPARPEKPAPLWKPAVPAGAVEVELADDSTLKLILHDEPIELHTRFGKLLIPVGEVQKIEFGRRIPDEVGRRIARAVEGLGASDFRTREAASTELLALRDKAYPALAAAVKSPDAEVSRRAEKLLELLREEVPEEYLLAPDHDVVYTADGSRLVGRIAGEAFRVRSAQFGALELKLADARSLRRQGLTEPEANHAAPDDPGTLAAYQGQVGKTLSFRVTGAVGAAGAGRVGGGAVWGTDVYTLDSPLATAAVHAGVLKAGQTGVVRIKLLGPTPAFQGSTRNGITSSDWGPYNGAYQFVKRKGPRGP